MIKIELWPHGDETRAREIGRAEIANVGGTVEYGNYDVRLFKSAEYAKSENVGKIYKRGHVGMFARRNSPWRLLRLALEACKV